jgi:hypothetical protein
MANEKSIPPVDDVGVRGRDALKSAASGWKAIQAGKNISRQERIIKEREEKAVMRASFQTSTPSKERRTKLACDPLSMPWPRRGH